MLEVIQGPYKRLFVQKILFIVLSIYNCVLLVATIKSGTGGARKYIILSESKINVQA
jgi:hypothetical protein